MRVLTKEQLREEFSARLNELLDEAGAPSRGRAQWLSDTFKRTFSREAARKWLESESLPDETHKAILCTAFGWSSDYLTTGIGPKYAGNFDPDLEEIINDWRKVAEDGRKSTVRNFRNERDLQGLRPPTPITGVTPARTKRKQ